jgi:hypothetical protein
MVERTNKTEVEWSLKIGTALPVMLNSSAPDL